MASTKSTRIPLHRHQSRLDAPPRNTPGSLFFFAVPALALALGCLVSCEEPFGTIHAALPEGPVVITPVLSLPNEANYAYELSAPSKDITVKITNRADMVAQAGADSTGNHITWQWYVTTSPNPKPLEDTKLAGEMGTLGDEADIASCKALSIDTGKKGTFYYYVVVTNEVILNNVPLKSAATSSLVTIAVGVDLTDTYAIALKDDNNQTLTLYHFVPQSVGYTAPTVLRVTVTNTGAADTGALAVSLGDDDAAKFMIKPEKLESIASKRSLAGAFTVQPKPGLEPGTYVAKVTVGPDVSAGNANALDPKTFAISFIVNTPDLAVYEDGAADPLVIHDFSAQTQVLSVTVKNTGAADTGTLTAELVTGKDSFTLTPKTLPSIPSKGSLIGVLTVQPKANLNPGTHEALITLKADTRSSLSVSFAVIFTVTVSPRLGIKLTRADDPNADELSSSYQYVFPQTTTGYTPSKAPDRLGNTMILRIHNTGTGPTGALKIASSPAEFGFWDSGASTPKNPITIESIDVGESVTIAVTPMSGLTAGAHTATVTVASEGSDLLPKSFDVFFTVIDPVPYMMWDGSALVPKTYSGNITTIAPGSYTTASSGEWFLLDGTPNGNITIAGDANIILKNDGVLNGSVTSTGSLNIYAQSAGTGKITPPAAGPIIDAAGDLEIHGGQFDNWGSGTPTASGAGIRGRVIDIYGGVFKAQGVGGGITANGKIRIGIDGVSASPSIEAAGGASGPGIGGSDIEILGGQVTGKNTQNFSGIRAASVLTISGGTITAQGGSGGGAGIRGDRVTISGGEIEKAYGGARGSGLQGGSAIKGDQVTITGNALISEVWGGPAGGAGIEGNVIMLSGNAVIDFVSGGGGSDNYGGGAGIGSSGALPGASSNPVSITIRDNLKISTINGGNAGNYGGGGAAIGSGGGGTSGSSGDVIFTMEGGTIEGKINEMDRVFGGNGIGGGAGIGSGGSGSSGTSGRGYFIITGGKIMTLSGGKAFLIGGGGAGIGSGGADTGSSGGVIISISGGEFGAGWGIHGGAGYSANGPGSSGSGGGGGGAGIGSGGVTTGISGEVEIAISGGEFKGGNPQGSGVEGGAGHGWSVPITVGGVLYTTNFGCGGGAGIGTGGSGGNVRAGQSGKSGDAIIRITGSPSFASDGINAAVRGGAAIDHHGGGGAGIGTGGAGICDSDYTLYNSCGVSGDCFDFTPPLTGQQVIAGVDDDDNINHQAEPIGRGGYMSSP